MSLYYFPEIFLPYHLCKVEKGWLVTNREYAHLGSQERRTMDEMAPVDIKLPEKFLKKLISYPDKPGEYWFYDDLNNPAANSKNAEKYLKLLKMFMGCKSS